MPNERSPFDLAIDRSMLVTLQSLAAGVIARMEEIKAHYPAGTFEELEESAQPENIIDALDLEEQEAEQPEPPVKKRRKAIKVSSLGLSDTIRAALAGGAVNSGEFAREKGYKRASVDSILTGFTRKDEARRVGPATYEAGPNLKVV